MEQTVGGGGGKQEEIPRKNLPRETVEHISLTIIITLLTRALFSGGLCSEGGIFAAPDYMGHTSFTSPKKLQYEYLFI